MPLQAVEIFVIEHVINIVPSTVGEGFLFEVIMGRENCVMFDFQNGVMYCAYYDYHYMSYQNVTECPEGLDNEDDWDYDDEELDY